MGKRDLELWAAEARHRAIRQGFVGDIEWLVAPMAPMPSLNGYLHLTPGHPWLEDHDHAWNDAPSEVTFSKGRWIGVDGAHGNDHWQTEELRQHVRPFPEEWDLMLKTLEEHGLSWPIVSRMPGWDREWTVDSWTDQIIGWAESAERSVSPVLVLPADMVSAAEEKEQQRGGND